MTDNTNAVRRFLDISFDDPTAHVALVSKEQGGPANGYTTLVTKAIQQPAPEVSVDMTMESFLTYFFDMWRDDAQALAKLLGYADSRSAMDALLTQYGVDNEYSLPDDVYRDYIDAFYGPLSFGTVVTVLKSLQSGEKKIETLSDTELLAVKKAKDGVAVFVQKTAGNQSDQKEKSKVSNDTILADIKKAAEEVQVLKAQLQATSEQNKELQEQVAVLKQKAEADAEAVRIETRKAALKAVAPADTLDVLVDSLKSVSDDAFRAVVDTMKANLEVAKAAMQEVGVSATENKVEDNQSDYQAFVRKAVSERIK